MRGRIVVLLVFGALAAAAVAAPAIGGRAATLEIDITFSPTGAITVALPDGTPVGAPSGQPTQIPAGYYTLELSGPGACTALPTLEIKGPGVDIHSDMTAGEVDATSVNVFFRPSSSYTWQNDSTPATLYTFTTSATAVNLAPVPTPPAAASSKKTVTSEDVVGSEIAPARGVLRGTVSAGGRVALSLGGRPVTSLAAGRYRLRVVDASTTSGFVLARGRTRIAVSSAAFVGTRVRTVALARGRWSLEARPAGPAARSIPVR